MRQFFKRTTLCFLAMVVAAGISFGGGKQEPAAAPEGDPTASRVSVLGLDVWPTIAEYTAETGRTIQSFNEAPQLAALVARGELPPLRERLPDEPFVVSPTNEIGEYSGPLYTHRSDLQSFVHEGITAHNPNGSGIIPSVARAIQWSNDYRTLTVWLREGMKWSDGHPFTADDIVFWYNDVLLNKDLTPRPSTVLSIGGELGVIEKVDDYTFTWSFSIPYPLFTMYLGSWGGVRRALLAPKHYLTQFHPEYAEKGELDRVMRAGGFTEWTDLFSAKNDLFNPELPQLGPWTTTTTSSQTVQRWVRNPYYFKVDVEGNQLPYVEELVSVDLADSQAALLKVMAGEIDYAHIARVGGVTNLPMLLENAERGNYNMDHTGTWMPNCDANIMFNFTQGDNPARSELYMDVRFRRALSVAINREEINHLIYEGRNRPSQVAPAAGPPYYGDSELFQSYAQHDTELANKLLDEIGLTRRDSEGFRLGLDGQPLTLVAYVNTVRDWWVDVMETVRIHWARAGIRVAVRGEANALWWARHRANEHDISMRLTHFGGGPVHPSLNQNAFALAGWQWAPLWALWLDTDGAQGVEPPADVKRIREIHGLVLSEPSVERQDELINEVYRIHMDNLWSLGLTVDDPSMGQLRTINNRLKNVAEVQQGEPDTGYFAQFFIRE